MKIYSVPGRICLFGDHMDWLGKSVITSAIDKRIFCKISESDRNSIYLTSYAPFTESQRISLDDLSIHHESDFRYVEAVISLLHKKVDLGQGLDLEFFKPNPEFDETLPAGKGLSSSAALCVVTSAALLNTFDTYYADNSEFVRQCAENAYVAEHDVLGINCGRMDPYACALGGNQYINCGTGNFHWRSVASLSNLSIVIGDSCKVKDTEHILGWLKRRYNEGDTELHKGIEGISKIVSDAYTILSQNVVDYKLLCKLIDKNQYFIEYNLRTSGDCPISPSNLNELIHAARKAGAMGAKVTGSGGGGCMIALCKPRFVEKVKEAIVDTGGTPIEVVNSETGISCPS